MVWEPAALEDQPQFARADDGDRIADRRIIRDAALESRCGGFVVEDLADQIDLRHRDVLVVVQKLLGAQRDVGDQADQERLAGPHAEKLADRGAGAFRATAATPAAGRRWLASRAPKRPARWARLSARGLATGVRGSSIGKVISAFGENIHGWLAPSMRHASWKFR